MATDFIGTNTEKVDKLVGAVIEMRTTVRFCLTGIGVGLPLALGLLTFLVVQSFSTVAKVERLGERVEHLEQKVDRLGDRVERLEQKIDRLGERLERIEPKAGKQ